MQQNTHTHLINKTATRILARVHDLIKQNSYDGNKSIPLTPHVLLHYILKFVIHYTYNASAMHSVE